MLAGEFAFGFDDRPCLGAIHQRGIEQGEAFCRHLCAGRVHFHEPQARIPQRVCIECSELSALPCAGQRERILTVVPGDCIEHEGGVGHRAGEGTVGVQHGPRGDHAAAGNTPKGGLHPPHSRELRGNAV